MAFTIYCDGLCEPYNPGGTATYGFVIYQDDKKMKEGWGVIGTGRGMTNNIAEYTAGIKAIEWMLSNGYMNDKMTLKSDSQLLIYQLAGSYAVRSPRIRPLYNQLCSLLKNFKQKSYRWIPRESNEEADALSRRAYYGEAEITRNMRAEELVDIVTKVDGGYKVKTYFIPEDLSTCECIDFERRCQFFGIRCKHILAVEKYQVNHPSLKGTVATQRHQ